MSEFSINGKLPQVNGFDAANGAKYIKDKGAQDMVIAELLSGGLQADGVFNYAQEFDKEGNPIKNYSDGGKEFQDCEKFLTKNKEAVEKGKGLFNKATNGGNISDDELHGYVNADRIKKLGLSEEQVKTLHDPKFLLAAMDERGVVTDKLVQIGLGMKGNKFEQQDFNSKLALISHETANVDRTDGFGALKDIGSKGLDGGYVSRSKLAVLDQAIRIDESIDKPSSEIKNQATKILARKNEALAKYGSLDKLPQEDKDYLASAEKIMKDDPKLKSLTGYDMSGYLGLKEGDDFGNKCKLIAFLRFCDGNIDKTVTIPEAVESTEVIKKYEN